MKTRYLHRRPPPAVAPAPRPAPPPVSRPAPSSGLRPVVAHAPAPPAKKPPEPPLYEYSRVHYAVLAGILLLAWVLRMREALSSRIIAAEDPYLHMERTWNLLQHHRVGDYPIGFMVLLAPFAAAGPTTLYYAARFLPPLAGPASVLAVFLLCRRQLHPAGALTAALLVAVMPEHQNRTNILFPTALDMVLVPLFLLAVLRMTERRTSGLVAAVVIVAAMAAIHPYVLIIVALPAAIYGLVLLLRSEHRKGWVTAGGVSIALAAVGAYFSLRYWSVGNLVTRHAMPRFAQLVRDPSSLFPLPAEVNLARMLTWVGLLTGFAGLVVAFIRPRRIALLGAVWVLTLLPLVLVDWFGVWYVPHRTVVYLSIGLAVLAGVAVTEAMERVPESWTRRPHVAAFVVVGAVFLLALPQVLQPYSWYRLYGESDYQAWEELDSRGTPMLVTGSWQARAGYRALTSREAVYNPSFFKDVNTRNDWLKRFPDLVVLVDDYAVKQKLPTDWTSEWQLVGQWGPDRAYAKPAR